MTAKHFARTRSDTR